MTNYKLQKAEQGFTLIELSIVLVIIGLIVGGVLVGQDLIRAAEIRATVTQVEKYNTAVNTFRGKYNGIPGDLAYASAAAFGFLGNTAITSSSTGVGGAGFGDGNGLIDGGAANTVAFVGEPVMFWNELSTAGYTDGAFGATGVGATANTAALASAASANVFMPPAKLGRGNSVNVASVNGTNYFLIGGFGSGSGGIAAGGAYGIQANSLTPQEAYNIDKKTDDGLPNSGTIMALDLATALSYTTLGYPGTGVTTAGVSSAACTSTAGGANYALGTSPSGTAQACSLRLRFN